MKMILVGNDNENKDNDKNNEFNKTYKSKA